MNLLDLFFFVECQAHHQAAAENNIGTLNPVPMETAATNTGTHVMYAVAAKQFKVDKHSFCLRSRVFCCLQLYVTKPPPKQTWQW